MGERFVLPSRTMTEALFLAFQAASGDNHPIHYNVEYCRAHGLPGMLAHGFQTLIQTAPGAGLFPFITEDSLVGFLEQSSRFLKPVFAGDTLYPALKVDRLSPNQTSRCRRPAQHGPQPAAGDGAGGTVAVSAQKRLMRPDFHVIARQSDASISIAVHNGWRLLALRSQ
jgi:acyl dehydratase